MSEILDRLGQVNLDTVLTSAIAAAKAAADQNWGDLKEFAKKAAKGLINTGIMISKLLAEQKLTPDEARELLEEEKSVARIQVRSAIGIGLVIAQKVINAVLDVLRGTFNTVVGFAVL